jgi:hypothetical protein
LCACRALRKHLDKALKELGRKTKDGTLKDDEFLFLRYMLAKQELSPSEITTIALPLFTDGLPTVRLYCHSCSL